MIKLMSLVNKRKDLTHEEFKAYWLNNHSQFEKKLVQTTPAKKISTSFATGEVVGGVKPIFDGMVEIYFNNIEDARAAFASPASELMRKDEAKFMDLSEEINRIVTEEYIQGESEIWATMEADTSKPKTKIVRTVKRRTGLTREQFKDYWLHKHVQLEKMRVEKTLVRRILATFLTGEMMGGKDPVYDGMVSLYFDNVDSLKKHFATGSHSVMRKDEGNFVDLSYEVVRVISEEYTTARK
jgi:uncharacterized protein (TIGR02118 family)